MTIEQMVGLGLALLLMAVGLAGSVLPGLPGSPIVLIAALAHKFYFGALGAAWWVLGLLAGLVLVSVLVDYVASVYGARRLGATWRGAVGAITGGLVGLFFSIPGLLIGPFVGAMLFEMAGGREWKAASRAGLGATLGLLAGTLGKLACCVAMIGIFTMNVLYQSLG